MSAPSDAELVAGMHAEGESLRTLFGRYARLIHRVAAHILGDAAEAEDVTQEVFFELYRKAHLYDPSRGSVRVWFLQYTYRRTLRRKAKLRHRAAYRAEPIEIADTPIELGTRRLTPEECRWVIRAGLAQLPACQRTTLELTWFEGLSLREVADRLGVSLGCARHYYYRGLGRLRAWARLALSASECGTADGATRRAPRPHGRDDGRSSPARRHRPQATAARVHCSTYDAPGRSPLADARS